jgi:hypothetical protein
VKLRRNRNTAVIVAAPLDPESGVNQIFTIHWKGAQESAQSHPEPGNSSQILGACGPGAHPPSPQAGAILPTRWQEMDSEEVLGLVLLSALAGAMIFAFVAIPPL